MAMNNKVENNRIEFSEWKRRLLARLINIASTATDTKEKEVLNALINALRYLRFRDVSGYLADLWAYCDSYKKYEICREFTEQEITE